MSNGKVATLLSTLALATLVSFSSISVNAESYPSPELHIPETTNTDTTDNEGSGTESNQTVSEVSNEASSNDIVLDNVDQLGELLEIPDGGVVTVIGTSRIGSIQAEGDLTIVGEGSAKLFVSNTSHKSSHMGAYPGIVAKGSISIRNVNIVDSSNGTAIADVSGSKGGITIEDSVVTVKNSGSSRYYGIRSIEGITISSSEVTVEPGYSECGIFCFGKLIIDDSDVLVEEDGKYTISSVDEIISGRNLKITAAGQDAKADTYADSSMFMYDKPISTIVSDNNAGKGKVEIKKAVGYSITVVGGTSNYDKGYEGEVISLVAVVPEGKKFVNWKSSNNIEFTDATAISTSFKMIAEDVSVEAVFEDIEVVDPVSDNTSNTGSSGSSSGSGSSSSGSSSSSSGNNGHSNNGNHYGWTNGTGNPHNPNNNQGQVANTTKEEKKAEKEAEKAQKKEEKTQKRASNNVSVTYSAPSHPNYAYQEQTNNPVLGYTATAVAEDPVEAEVPEVAVAGPTLNEAAFVPINEDSTNFVIPEVIQESKPIINPIENIVNFFKKIFSFFNLFTF